MNFISIRSVIGIVYRRSVSDWFILFFQKKSSYGHERRRMNNRTNLAQRGEVIRRTVYVSDIDHQVGEMCKRLLCSFPSFHPVSPFITFVLFI